MLLQVPGPIPGVCLVLAQVSPDVAYGSPSIGWGDVTRNGSSLHLFICFFCVCICAVYVYCACAVCEGVQV